jgi:hypothetical protein
MQPLRDFFDATYTFLVILLSSVVGFFKRNEGNQFSIRAFFLDVMCAQISGFVAYSAMVGLGQPDSLAISAASCFGYLGPAGLNFVMDWARKKFFG